MASLSLPRVLQLKKNSLDAEREQFEKFQTLAIQKAINAVETPVKEKHVRSTIIGTFQEQSAITYWMVAIRLPLQDNRIVSWKFCHVTHKLLREGHPACLDDSQRHINMIENLGKLWVHLREGYGKLVHLYCNLLVCKLKFHARNPRFPGNMQLTADELDAIAENDVNNYFQLCVELFDYMDDILTLQAAVFDSLGNARANSMTASGQCRLAALIPCAQDASQIYDCNVRLLFRLHASLPSDTLQGHRERFRQQFKKLSSFYKHASSLQYYRNLLTLPVLPSNPPNFLQQSDFGTYVTPVVSIPEQPPDEVDSVASLIDTSDTMSQMSAEHVEETFERPTPSPQPDPIMERDRLIDHLQHELKRMRLDASQLVQERNTMLGSMKEHCTRLESQLQSVHSELNEEKQRAELLSSRTPEIQQKLTETEEKAKVQDEKFQKLKGAYTQLREEHISLIRQKAEVDKLSATLRAAAAQHESAKTQLQQQLNDRMKDVELLQQSASSSEEIEQYQNQITELRSELEKSREKEITLAEVKASLEALEIEHQTTKTEHEDKMNMISSELKEATENLEVLRKEKEERETELSRVKSELIGLREKSGDEYKKVVEEREAALKQVADLTVQHLQEKEELTLQMRARIDEQQTEIVSLEQKLLEMDSNFEMECERLNEELNEKHKELDMNLGEKDIEIKKALEEISKLERKLENTINGYENKLEDLVSHKDHEMNSLKTEMQAVVDKNNNEINKLQKILEETSQKGELQNSERLQLSLKVNELETDIENKAKELEERKSKLDELTVLIAKMKIEHGNEIKESKHQIEILDNKLQNLTENKDEIINNFKTMVKDKDNQIINLNVEVTKQSEEISRLSEQLDETQAELEICNNELITLKEEHENIIQRSEDNMVLKNQAIRDLENKLEDLVSHKDHEMNSLKTEMQAVVDKNNNEINKLQKILEETSQKGELQNSERLQLSLKVNELETDIENKAKELEEGKSKLDELTVVIENMKIENENEIMESKHQIEILDNKLQNLTENKDEIINNFKTMVTDKDNQLINLNVEVTKQSEEISRLSEQLDETQAELEICNNELITLKEEHENIIQRSEDNVVLKNQALRDLHDEIKELKGEKQVLEARITELQKDTSKLTSEYDNFKIEQEYLITKLNNELKQTIDDKDKEIQTLNEQMQSQEARLKNEISTGNEMMSQIEASYQSMKTELEEMQTLRTKEKEAIESLTSEKDKENQILEARLSHIDVERLNTECELQDLLQHNSVLEADVSALRRQLEEAQKKIEDQSTKLVAWGGEAAVEVVNNALAAMERSSAQQSNKAAAELAAKALDELQRHTVVKGNEESVVKSVVAAAHNAAQVSAYVTEVSQISTNMDLAEKLNSECRTMLTATKQCLETISKGEATTSSEARNLVRSVIQAATAADIASVGARSVDDELADMDQAIEQAASKIEEMLAASRAGDSGVKLEVNEKILDACTTLMAAVKILVQDSRKLQNELGDPVTRLKMYRKNPQWSEGLISASKAVVFAAKLLVTSADEVVASGSRVEGVSAAAHEVAAATAQLVAASRARAPPAAPSLASLTQASKDVAGAVGALVAAVRSAANKHRDAETLDTSALTLTATRILEMESKVRSLELESELEAERVRLAALRKRHYQLAQQEENGNVTNGKE